MFVNVKYRCAFKQGNVSRLVSVMITNNLLASGDHGTCEDLVGLFEKRNTCTRFCSDKKFHFQNKLLIRYIVYFLNINFILMQSWCHRSLFVNYNNSNPSENYLYAILMN